MRISIVIPAYNEEALIAETINAALAQDYPDFEVIVVNNASTDKTAEVVRQFPSVRLVNEPSKGLLHARERGRTEAAGEIIANLDADCLPPRDWLSNAVKTFADPEVAAVTGPYDYYDGSRVFRYVSINSQRSVYWFVSEVMDFFDKGGILIGGNNLIRAKALKAAGGYNTAIKFYGEDTDTARRISEQGKIVFSRDQVVRTSARRFKAEGTAKITTYYLYHFLKVGILPALLPHKNSKV